MLTGQNIVIGITVVLLIWWVAGSWITRRRAAALIAAIRQAPGVAGHKPAIRWFGRSAFQIDVGEPAAPVVALRMLCLLEPREFPLAHAWNRLRGRKDQVVIQAEYGRALRTKPDLSAVRGISEVTLRAEKPHLQVTLQVGAGQEASIEAALNAIARGA